MKKELKILLAMFMMTLLMLSVSMVLTADDTSMMMTTTNNDTTNDDDAEDTNGEESEEASIESKWVLVHANGKSIHVINESSDYLIIKYDNYIQRNPGAEKYYLNTLIQPNEYRVLPSCEDLFIRTSISKIEKVDSSTIKVTN